MKIFKFTNRKQRKKNVIFILFSVLLGFFLFSAIKRSVFDTHVAFLIVSIFSFISVRVSARKASFEISEMLIEKGVVKLYYFKTTKNALIVEIKDIKVEYDDNKIELFKKETSLFLGRAHKYKIEDIEKWKELINIFPRSA